MDDPSADRSDGRHERACVDGGRPPLDRVLEGLSRELDRRILYHLADDEPAEFDDLVTAVGGDLSGESPDSIPADVESELRIRLHHVRLPKLERLGIVEYDPRSQAVRFRNPPPRFEEFLELARELEED